MIRIIEGAKGPYLLEVVGVAGVGKSTIFRSLLSDTKHFKQAWRFRTLYRFPATLSTALRLLPHWIALELIAPRLHAVHVKYLASMEIQHDLYRIAPQTREQIHLFDQGPVYALNRLRSDERQVLRNPGARHIVDHCISIWSQRLDCIVFLDAPDEVLYERTRPPAVMFSRMSSMSAARDARS